MHFSQGVLQNIWLVLHDRGWIEIADIKLRTSYPILPWIGVILLGYALGQFFSSKYTAKQRGRVLLSLGLASIDCLFYYVLSTSMVTNHGNILSH